MGGLREGEVREEEGDRRVERGGEVLEGCKELRQVPCINSILHTLHTSHTTHTAHHTHHTHYTHCTHHTHHTLHTTHITHTTHTAHITHITHCTLHTSHTLHRVIFGNLVEVRGDRYANTIDSAPPQTFVIMHIYDEVRLHTRT